MKPIIPICCLLTVATLCGCIYEIPLVEEATVPVDLALTGMWQAIPEEGGVEEADGKMVILPFSANEYVVVYPPGEEDAFVFRAYPVCVEDMPLIQLEWLNSGPKSKNRYHICRYTLKTGILTVETLNEKIAGSAIPDSKVLRETLLANRDNPDLFRDPVRYRKLEE